MITQKRAKKLLYSLLEPIHEWLIAIWLIWSFNWLNILTDYTATKLDKWRE